MSQGSPVPCLTRTVGALACAGALICGALSSAAPVTGSAGFGAEQATLALLSYRLPVASTPPGYVLEDEVASTNAAVAFGASEAERSPTLARLVDSGRITGIQQLFGPDIGSTAQPVDILISLYRSAGAAAAAVADTAPPGAIRPFESLVAPVLGDGARAVKTGAGDDGGSIFLIAWSRGPLFFAVAVSGSDALPDTANAFALALDTRASAAGAFGLDIPRGLPDGGNELSWASTLDGAQLPVAAAPTTLTRSGAYLWSNEQLVLDSHQPMSVAARLTGDQRRITGEVEYFTDDRSRTLLSSVYAVFADAAGAEGAMRDDPLGSGTRQAIVPMTAPVQLGDETVAFESVLRWPRGELRESYTVQWRHGAIVLAITLNQPSGRPAPTYLGDVATALDRAFAASTLAQSR